MLDTCSAVVFKGDGTWERRDDFKLPDPPPGGAVLAVEAVGLCHSDLAQLQGQKHVPEEIFPTVPGHEIVGRIYSLAPDADLGVAVGDRVAVNIVTFGETSIENPFGVRCYGYSFSLEEAGGLWGGYGEYMSVLPGTQLVRFVEGVDSAELTIFEPLSNVIAWLDRARFESGSTIVVQGPGHMGLTCAALARYFEAGTVIVTGTAGDGHRLAVAQEVGADVTIDVSVDDPVKAVAEVTSGVMADVVVDLTSSPSTPGLCLDLVRHGGQVVWAGLKNCQATPLTTDQVVLKALTVHGGAGGNRQSIVKAVEILNGGAFPTGPLLGEVVGLDQIDHAMDLLNRTAEKDAVRAVLVHPH